MNNKPMFILGFPGVNTEDMEHLVDLIKDFTKEHKLDYDIMVTNLDDHKVITKEELKELIQ